MSTPSSPTATEPSAAAHFGAAAASGRDAFARSLVSQPLLTPRFVRLLLLQFTFGLGFSVFFLFPKYMADCLGSGPAQIGQATAAGPLLAALAVPWTAGYLDRRRRRGPILAGGVLLALASVGLLLSNSFGPWLLLMRGLQGMTFTLFFSATGTLAADEAPQHRLSQAIGLVSLAMLVTNAISPAMVEPLAARHGWGVVFVLAAACGTASVCLGLGLEDRTSSSRESAPSLRHLADRRSLIVLGCAAAVGVAFGTVTTFFQPWLLERGTKNVGGLFIGYTLTAVFARIVLGSVADSVGRHRVSLGALVLYTIVVFSMVGLTSQNLLALGAGLGLAHGLLYPALSAMLVENRHATQRGSAVAFFTGTFNAGFALSSLGFGALAAWLGYPSVFVAAGLITLTAVFALSRLPHARES